MISRDLSFETSETIIDSPNFLIFAPGSWASWNNPPNIAARDAIIKLNIASVLLYESKRKLEITQKPNVNQAEWISAFDGKTYQDELKELRERIDHVINTYNPKNLFLSGRSYGGGLAALVSGDGIPNLNRVLLVSPQIICPEHYGHYNIYQEFQPREKFLEAMSRYKGRLMIVWGEYESAAFKEQSEMLFKAATAPAKKKIEVKGADHSFSGEAAERYILAHLEAFMGKTKS
ncbi:hypothetical protein HYS31_03785 [Candidatus Woesearchaeota archaeon]|nr:hypothetical protein [Candidatus Woesearchaeota archaeon]